MVSLLSQVIRLFSFLKYSYNNLKLFVEISIRILFYLLMLISFPLNGVAKESNKYTEIEKRYIKYYVNYYVKNDFAIDRITEVEIKALSERAVKNLKTQKFTYSTSIEKFEVLEAYTKKKNGEHINVPEDNYQINVNKGNRKGGPVFSDRTRISIIFPELEVNDSIVMKVKKIETEPMFPGHLSESQYFWDQIAYDDVRIKFNYPKELDIQHQVRGMKEKLKIKNDRVVLELFYKNKKPLKNDRDDFTVWNQDSESGFAISTFKDYKSIAEAYGIRALPKALPDKRVRKLAAKIVGKEKEKLKQARLLYDWVVMNITYAGNCIGVGAVVPRDTDFILDNKMGDCKDHATLLEALFTSVGIESDQALINSGSSYHLPKIPMVSSVNHVMTYLPEWNRFVDATNSIMPFDMLGFSVSDKPILLVKNFKPGMRTPATQLGSNKQEVDSAMKINKDGSVVGYISIKLKGNPAVNVRQSWRNITKEQEEKWIEEIFSSDKKIGSGSIKKDDPSPLLSDFKYTFEFNQPDFILSKGVGSFYIGPLVSLPMSMYAFMSYSNKEISGYDIACSNGYSLEKLSYELPKEMKILAKPEDFEIVENHIEFKAKYELIENNLNVVREINDKTPGNICSAELMNAQRKTLIKIAENLKSQIVYQH